MKLDNTLSLRYPKEKLQILVASDGSTDQTNAIVKDYGKEGIDILAFQERRGKETAQKENKVCPCNCYMHYTREALF